MSTPASTVPSDGGEDSAKRMGIAIAHYKTPLRVLLHQATHLLDELAKERCERRVISLSHYSRGGVKKSEFAMRWSVPGQPPEAHKVLECV